MPTTLSRKPKNRTTLFRLRKTRLVGLIVLGLMLFLPGISMAIFLLFVQQGGDTTVTIVVLIMALAVVGVGYWGIFYAVRRLLKSPDGFAVAPEGLFDPTIHTGALPWDEIQRPAFRYSGIIGWRLMFDVSPDAEARLSVPRRRRQAAALWRAFGARCYRLYLFGTEADVAKLRAVMAPYLTVDMPGTLTRLLGRE